MSTIISVDQKLFFWINGIAGKVPILDRVMSVLVDDYFVITSLALIILFIWFGAQNATLRQHDQRAVLYALIGFGLVCLFIHLFTLYGPFRLRPYDALSGVHLLTYMRTDPSFPSEPTAIAFALASGIWLSKRRIGLVMLLLAALWGLARVYCGIHYPLDVVAGALIGFVTSLMVFMLFRLFQSIPTSILRWTRRLYLA